VETASAARLHFGFLDVTGALGRRFGSVGLSISGPAVRVRARRAAELSVSAACAAAEDGVKSALRYAAMFRERTETREAAGDSAGAEIFLDETIPPHRGFGSGTQLALSVVSSLARLHEVECSPAEAARITGRGLRSGRGIESFAGGGFIVDAGVGEDCSSPLTLFRADFPEDWRAVTALPPGRAKGLNGEEEKRAFADMSEPDCASAGETCRIVLMKLLPAILEKKISEFGEALRRIQEIMGESFAPFQAGKFASPMAEDIFAKMGELGGVGMGQSSWGPLVYCFAAGEAAAGAIASGVKGYFSRSGVLCGGDLEVSVAAGRNHGAVTRVARGEKGEY
jgi:beta-RFAP synthase